MKSHEPTVATGQGVRRDAAEQLSGDWHTNLIDFDGPSFLEHDRVRVSHPADLSAGRAFELGARLFECRLGALQIVLAAVAFHRGGSIPREGPGEGSPCRLSSDRRGGVLGRCTDQGFGAEGAT
jgi:hypothetical protein